MLGCQLHHHTRSRIDGDSSTHQRCSRLREQWVGTDQILHVHRGGGAWPDRQRICGYHTGAGQNVDAQPHVRQKGCAPKTSRSSAMPWCAPRRARSWTSSMIQRSNRWPLTLRVPDRRVEQVLSPGQARAQLPRSPRREEWGHRDSDQAGANVRRPALTGVVLTAGSAPHSIPARRDQLAANGHGHKVPLKINGGSGPGTQSGESDRNDGKDHPEGDRPTDADHQFPASSLCSGETLDVCASTMTILSNAVPTQRGQRHRSLVGRDSLASCPDGVPHWP